MTFVLTSNHGQSSGASFSIGTAQNVGDLMVVGAGNFSGTETISAISDSFGTVYNKFVFAGGGNTYALIWGNLAGTGANTMSVTWSAGSANVTEYGEFTGTAVAAAQDAAGKSASGTGTSTATPTFYTAGFSDLVVNFVYCPSGVTGFAFGGAWSTANIQSTSSGLGYQADVPANTTCTPSASWTGSSAWGSLVVAFKTPDRAIFTPTQMLGSGAMS